MEKYKFLIICFIIISFISVLLTCYDKIAAKNGWYRIPEAGLMCLGLIGGAISMYIIMRIIHHKTKHRLFMIGLPIEIILNIVIFFAVFYK